jgi:hypothetical protein
LLVSCYAPGVGPSVGELVAVGLALGEALGEADGDAAALAEGDAVGSGSGIVSGSPESDSIFFAPRAANPGAGGGGAVTSAEPLAALAAVQLRNFAVTT